MHGQGWGTMVQEKKKATQNVLVMNSKKGSQYVSRAWLKKSDSLTRKRK